MKILVCSDSHGHTQNFYSVLDEEKDADYCFFLGDGLREAEDMSYMYPNIKFILVSGNCDFYSMTDTVAYKYIDSLTFMACHGHEFDVKRTLVRLCEKAASVRADIALYGHTHRRDMYDDTRTGIFALNPGALRDGQYAVITTEKGKFTVEEKTI